MTTWHLSPIGCGWPGRGVGGWFSTKFYTGRLCPKVQTLILLYTIFDGKGNLIRIPSIDNWYSFNKPSLKLELCILLTAVNTMSLSINHKTQNAFSPF